MDTLITRRMLHHSPQQRWLLHDMDDERIATQRCCPKNRTLVPKSKPLSSLNGIRQVGTVIVVKWSTTDKSKRLSLKAAKHFLEFRHRLTAVTIF